MVRLLTEFEANWLSKDAEDQLLRLVCARPTQSNFFL